MSSYPEVAINEYVWEQFHVTPSMSATYSSYSGTVPIFPVSDNVSGTTKWEGKTYIIYDSFIKPRSSNKYFYPIKAGQMMYSIKGTLENIYKWRDFISNVLDREDIAARDINNYAGENINNFDLGFHCINVTQANYIGNTTESSGTKKTYSTNLIIRYDYHITDIYNNS